jgi:high-affinity Fe2+/Pb2+ permease
MSDHEHYHDAPVAREPEGNGLVGYAAIKYAAIVIIVLAILAFIAWYLIPQFTS